MSEKNRIDASPEKLVNTGQNVIRALHHWAKHDDLQRAEIAAVFLEALTREGIDALMKLATQRPEVLKHRARMCADWPGFIPEHKASKEANKRMIKLIELGKRRADKTKGRDLGSLRQEMVTSMILELAEAKSTYEEKIKVSGVDDLMAWEHKAGRLPDLLSGMKAREEWFDCGWSAIEESCGEPLETHPQIRELGESAALKRASNRKEAKLRRAKKELKALKDRTAQVTPVAFQRKSKMETPEIRDLEAKIESIKAEEPVIWPSEICECAKDILRKAFIGRVR